MVLYQTLAIWAYGNESRIIQLQEWLDAAVLAVGNSGGRDVIQASANGVSTTFAAGMTNQDWLNTLIQALAVIQSGNFPTKKKQAFIPPCNDLQ